jgi:hypothetical protein
MLIGLTWGINMKRAKLILDEFKKYSDDKSMNDLEKIKKYTYFSFMHYIIHI